MTASWQGVTNRAYFLQRSAGLSFRPSFLTLAGNVPGQPVTTACTDANTAGSGTFFYRVGVRE